ncbi:DIE2/ALG10 family domain containing protein [Naviculisporaceae sp. PSN 640]
METVRVLAASLTTSDLVKDAIVAGVLVRFLHSRFPTKYGTDVSIQHFVVEVLGFFLLHLFGRGWLVLVNHCVPEPYLDEVFHIPQAQTYCEGRFWDWDDKITTPPGLYLLSVAYHKFWMLKGCTPFTLRHNNLLAVILTALLAALCRQRIEARTTERVEAERYKGPYTKPLSAETPSPTSLCAYHTAVNIGLFPVLFFFSGLYYTDVVSTLLVLVAYHNHLGRIKQQSPGILNDLWTVFLGVATLFMRQTNVFWAVVFMGGSEAVHAIRSLKPEPEEWAPFETFGEQVRAHVGRWAVGDIHDPGVDEAWPDDWLICLLSIAVAVICNPVKVLRQVWPHITILGLFAGFVAWNGGVVLGDKSNHVATIHLAQMLYIWPFLAFFSAPLFLPIIVEFLLSPLKAISTLIAGKLPTSNDTRPSGAKSPVLKITSLLSNKKVYYPLYIILTVIVSLAIVKFNTIIHPFTLADNRHYMFYVFRYTILRGAKIRYLLVGAYTAARWFIWRRLGGGVLEGEKRSPSTEIHMGDDQKKKRGEVDATSVAPLTSTVLLWVITTSLSLITAPLVEPRYFILPWVFFRLLVPAWGVQIPSSSSSVPSTEAGKAKPAAKPTGKPGAPQPSEDKKGILTKIWELIEAIDLSLALETIWFIVINLGTMYMFLYRPFYWRTVAEDGSEVLLDGGRLQRFMW